VLELILKMHRAYNGASFIGLQGIVVKSHGNATVLGFVHAILEAVKEAETDVPTLLSDKVLFALKDATTR